jgi:hypothetical protein
MFKILIDDLVYYYFIKQPSNTEIIDKKNDFLFLLIDLIKLIKSKNYNISYMNLLARKIKNHFIKYLPKKYDYIKKINNNIVYIHFKDDEIYYEDIDNINDFETYLINNIDFLRDHINYKMGLIEPIFINYINNINFINQIEKYVINNSNDYKIKNNIIEFIFINLINNNINNLSKYNKFYYYVQDIITHKKIFEINNINDFFDNYELLFCYKDNIIINSLFYNQSINIYKINIDVFEKAFNIINNFDKLPEIVLNKKKLKNFTSNKIIKKKQTIPKPLKKLVWNKWIGEEIGKYKCLCCKLTDITQLSFHCGHIIAESKGGKLHVDNLKPICNCCNSSMGTQDMNEYIKKYEF